MEASNPYEAPRGVPSPQAGPRRGIRLVEVLTVVAVIALLVALLLPATRSARGPARRAQCTNNLKQIGLALRNYEQAYGALPPAYTVDDSGRPLHSWRTLILPFMEQITLYETIDLTKPWDDPANARAREAAPGAYRCPASVASKEMTTYLASTGPDGCLLPGSPRPLAEITDDHGRTLLVVEAGEESAVPWMAPVDADRSLLMGLGPKTKTPHPGGVNALFVAGNVNFLKLATPAAALRAIWSIAGGDDDAAGGL